MMFREQVRIAGAVAHEVRGDRILASRGYKIYEVPDAQSRWRSLGALPVRRSTRALTRLRPAARLLRLGCAVVRETPERTLLAIGDRLIFRKEARANVYEVVHRIDRGSRPLHRGVCVTSEGRIFWGEYFGNPDRVSLHVFASEDDGRTFRVVHTFAAGKARHVHGIQQDPITGEIWIMTGDDGAEAAIYRADPTMKVVTLVGGGSQAWRSVSLLFSRDHVFWGTDSPSEQNWIMRYHRESGRLDRLQAVSGPVYYSAENQLGMRFFATSVEPEGRFVAGQAEVWASKDGSAFTRLLTFPKDRWHSTLFQFGVIQFPQGVIPGAGLWLSGTALRGIENTLVFGTVEA